MNNKQLTMSTMSNSQLTKNKQQKTNNKKQTTNNKQQTTNNQQRTPFPDHTQLPESDGTFVKNFQEHPQSIILTDSIGPILEQLHPEGDYAIGQDCGIYWRETEPPEQGAEAPDWFYVGGVPPLLNGEIRRSYVLWRELITPLIVLEFASGSGKEERDKTPLSPDRIEAGTKPGKFWVYERIIEVPYYGIYEIKRGKLEMYRLVQGEYRQLEPNQRGHYLIEPMSVELGLWQGNYQNQNQLWLRWWDKDGNLLLTGNEQVELEKVRTERERERAEVQRQRAELEKVRTQQAQQRAEQERQRAELQQQRAEVQQQRAEQAQQRAEQAQQRAEQEQQRAEVQQQRAERLEQERKEAISRLVQLGLTVQQIAAALNLSVEQVNEQ